jgi:hypothetical protein
METNTKSPGVPSIRLDARAGEQHLILKKQIEGDQNPKEIHYHKHFD